MKPKIKDSKIIHSGFYELREDVLENKRGALATYTSIHLPSAVSVVAQTKEGLWILNREYRHPTGEILLGPPGGRIDPNEEPLEAAQRELFEETGYWSDELTLLGCCHPFPGICNQKIYYVWAKNAVKKSEQALEPFEFIEVVLKTDEELRHELRNHTKVDGNLCTALWYTHMNSKVGF